MVIRRLVIGFGAAILAALIFVAGYGMGQSRMTPLLGGVLGGGSGANAAFAPFWEVWDLTHERYVDQPLDDTALMEGAIEGMLATLDDRYTRYLTPQSEAAEADSMAGQFQGIGAEVADVDGAITIVSPFDGSPAEEAGLRPGDILREANGVVLTGMDVSEAAGLVRGPAGTLVTLLIERDGETFTVDIERGLIQISSVRGEILPDGPAYVRLSRFVTPTTAELEAVLEDLLAHDPPGIILDMRMNPGGFLSTSIDVADQFLAEGVFVVERFGDGRETIYRTTNRGLADNIPLVVLVDEGTASAPELVAGALRDRGRAVLVGETTFGKGTVQSVHRLSNGGGLRITTARWLTPDGFSVHGQGLTPDYAISFEGALGAVDDPQLKAAADLLLGRPVINLVEPSPEN